MVNRLTKTTSSPAWRWNVFRLFITHNILCFIGSYLDAQQFSLHDLGMTPPGGPALQPATHQGLPSLRGLGP